MLATAVYLAGKMDETPQHIRHVVSEARNFWPDLMTADTSRLGECEFSLISTMNSQLIVHHPYRSLLELQAPLALTSEDVALAWYVVNDSYLTDLPLLYPPHVVALAAVGMGVGLKPSGGAGAAAGAGTKQQRLIAYLASSEVDVEGVVDATQEIVSLYEAWEGYSDKACKEAIARVVKGRGLDK